MLENRERLLHGMTLSHLKKKKKKNCTALSFYCKNLCSDRVINCNIVQEYHQIMVLSLSMGVVWLYIIWSIEVTHVTLSINCN